MRPKELWHLFRVGTLLLSNLFLSSLPEPLTDWLWRRLRIHPEVIKKVVVQDNMARSYTPISGMDRTFVFSDNLAKEWKQRN